MWLTNELGIASLEVGSFQFELDARGGADGIGFRVSNRLVVNTSSANVRFEPVGQQALPRIADQFVRGDEWHVALPQDQGTYSLDIVFRPIVESLSSESGQCAVLEATLSIHTSLLDSHPMIDLVVPSKSVRRARTIGDPSKHEACAAITLSDTASILLGPRDYPHTTDCSNSEGLRLRLFGEFLEKGVIRKARPWIVLGSPSDEMIQQLWDQLCESPLPLGA